MAQTVYCDCFYCLYFEENRCTAPVLHLWQQSSACQEFTPSEEKLEAFLDAQEANPPANPKGEYGAYKNPALSRRIR